MSKASQCLTARCAGAFLWPRPDPTRSALQGRAVERAGSRCAQPHSAAASSAEPRPQQLLCRPLRPERRCQEKRFLVYRLRGHGQRGSAGCRAAGVQSDRAAAASCVGWKWVRPYGRELPRQNPQTEPCVPPAPYRRDPASGLQSLVLLDGTDCSHTVTQDDGKASVKEQQAPPLVRVLFLACCYSNSAKNRDDSKILHFAATQLTLDLLSFCPQ